MVRSDVRLKLILTRMGFSLRSGHSVVLFDLIQKDSLALDLSRITKEPRIVWGTTSEIVLKLQVPRCHFLPNLLHLRVKHDLTLLLCFLVVRFLFLGNSTFFVAGHLFFLSDLCYSFAVMFTGCLMLSSLYRVKPPKLCSAYRASLGHEPILKALIVTENLHRAKLLNITRGLQYIVSVICQNLEGSILLLL